MKVYTFWEPREKIPYYIQLCMKTWEKFLPNAEIILLDYKNLGEYIDVNELGEMLFSGRFRLPQISDAIRVALLAKHGGVWLDADTIVLNSKAEKYLLPDEKNRTLFFGHARLHAPHIAYVNTPPASKCMNSWFGFIKERLKTLTPETEINAFFLGNSFINAYARENVDEVEVLTRRPVMPELKLIPKSENENLQNRMVAHQTYYHMKNLHLVDVNADMILLHNSWVPELYRGFSPEDLLLCDCTLTNILAEALGMELPPPEERFRLFQKENKKWIKVPNTPPPPKKFRLVTRKNEE
ncbi:MAG: hypothetical protein J5497_06515 [Selenomonadaceae bacterium]|nr:hypothetical protein [Selenomonadaceae bacterium]